MTFSETLNEYIDKIGCTGKELSESSGLSAAVISRYRSGERTPKQDSSSLEQLAAGLSRLSADKDPTAEEEILSALKAAVSSGTVEKLKTENLNALLELADISSSELAKYLNYDPSHISRIRSGERTPTDAEEFAGGVCRLILKKYQDADKKPLLIRYAGLDADASDSSDLYNSLMKMLFEGINTQPDYTDNFLSKLDDFDLNEYIEAIHFNEIKVPTLPFQLPTSKNYYGIEEMRTGEIDFFKATALSASDESVFMYSDMPVEDMAEDMDFAKKWMTGIAVMMKKALKLTMVHNLNRPFAEMMLGLESWIPLYMTGQVTPRYIPNSHGSIFCNLTYVSGAAALSGECVSGSHSRGKYYLTKNKEEIAYYRARSKDILKKTQPLMDIYRAENAAALKNFIGSEFQAEGVRHNILSAPPVYTLSEELLLRMTKRTGVTPEFGEQLISYVRGQKKFMEAFIAENTVFDELHRLSKEEFVSRPAKLSAAGAFFDKDIPYTFEEYSEHIRLTEEYARTHKNYSVNTNMQKAFRNIRIDICEKKWVMISKSNAPSIHFVIRHPKLRGEIENMMIPVNEHQPSPDK